MKVLAEPQQISVNCRGTLETEVFQLGSIDRAQKSKKTTFLGLVTFFIKSTCKLTYKKAQGIFPQASLDAYLAFKTTDPA